MKYFFRIVAAVVLLAASVAALARPNYQNFKVSIYTRAYEVQRMADQHWLDSTWNVISSQMKVDKIYLETHRDQLIVDRPTMEKAIRFFKQKGLEVAGGITYTISEANSFETYCYSDPVERAKAREIAEYTASLFDEVILDDFFFHDCKCEYCIAAKGDRNWTEYRLELMQDAAQNVVLGPAHAVNPKCKVVIKYPNWYDHFPALGFDLDYGPKHFDGIYTGTETRDAVSSDQHLQPAHLESQIQTGTSDDIVGLVLQVRIFFGEVYYTSVADFSLGKELQIGRQLLGENGRGPRQQKGRRQNLDYRGLHTHHFTQIYKFVAESLKE